ncbi:MAG: hypothetical protein QME12_00250 [Nanoarchaeota archaeon]|nr:hypothetical protein [Nanoarchaeota archaeon]
MEELRINAEEFMQSGEDNLKKKRYNAAVSDFFKAVAIICDYLIYKDMRILPKNHNERFSILRSHFKDIYSKVSGLFEDYTKSYNLRMDKMQALKMREYAYELKQLAFNKK